MGVRFWSPRAALVLPFGAESICMGDGHTCAGVAQAQACVGMGSVKMNVGVVGRACASVLCLPKQRIDFIKEQLLLRRRRLGLHRSARRHV